MTERAALPELVLAVQKAYPQVFLACHVEHVRRRSTPFQLSAADSSVLAHLEARRGIRPGDLAAHLGIAPSSLSATIARLVRLGFVERLRSGEDRRAAELRLAPRGVEALQATSVLDTARLGALLSRLAASEQRKAVAGLALLADGARRLRTDEGSATRWERRERRRRRRSDG